MNDCSNADIRDQLPDLLHDRLSASARAAVLAHVEGCVDCRDELELLRGVRVALAAHVPRIDIAYVVGALPKAPVSPMSPARKVAPTPHRRWADWRVAAAVTMLVAGGSSVALLNRGSNVATTAYDSIGASVPTLPDPTVPNRVATNTTSVNAHPQTVTPNTSRATATTGSTPTTSITVASADDQDVTSDAAPDGRLGGLSAAQLKALLGEIDRLQPVPVTEPEPVTLKVNVGNSTSPNGAGDIVR